MLGQLSGQEEPDSSLDLTGGDGGPLVVVSQLGGLSSNPLKDVVDERVHNAHGLGRDSGVRVDLLENLVNVDSIRLLPLLSLGTLLTSPLLGLGGINLRLARLLDVLTNSLGRHLWLSTITVR